MISFGNERIGSVHRNGLKANSLFFGRDLVFATGEYPLEFTKAGTFYFKFKPGRTYSLTLCGGGGGAAVYGHGSDHGGASGGGGAKITSSITVNEDTIAKIVVGKGGEYEYDDGAQYDVWSYGNPGGATSIIIPDGILSVEGGYGGGLKNDEALVIAGQGGSTYEKTGPFTTASKTNGGKGGTAPFTSVGGLGLFNGGSSGLGSSFENGRGGGNNEGYEFDGKPGYVKIA